MKPEEQRIAIAEYQGLKTEIDEDGELRVLVLCQDGSFARACNAPDYLNDLNAMHEVEKRIMDESSIDYYDNLVKYSCPWHATASQRAKAFLKTLKLWKE